MAQVIKNRLVRIVLWVVLSIVILITAVLTALQFSGVQTRLANSFAQRVYELTEFQITFDRVDITWLDEIKLKGLKVIDPEGHRLFYTDEALIDYQLEDLFYQDIKKLDEIIVSDAGLYLTKIAGDSTSTLNINLFLKRIRKLIKKRASGRRLFNIDRIEINNTHLTYFENDSSRTMRAGLDPKHFSLEHIYGEFNNFQSMSDTLLLDIESLATIEYLSGMELHSLKSKFHLSQSAMKFENLSLEVGRSYITDTVIFNYSSTRDLSDFVDKVTVHANLLNSTIHSEDIAYFTNSLKGYNEKIKINGDLDGKVKSFVLDNATIDAGNNSHIEGRIRMTGLPNFQETFVDLNLTNSRVFTSDVRRFMNEDAYTKLAPFKQVRFNASFLGFPNDFVADGEFITEFGSVTSDINLKLSEDITESYYKGGLKVNSFDAGAYAKDSIIGKVSMNGQIEGTGLSIESADFHLQGKIDKIELKGYTYQNIRTDGNFKKKFFKGLIEMNDPNAKFVSNGTIDLRNNINALNLEAKVDTINLKPLNLSKEDFFFHSNLQVNARGFTLDEIVGEASFLNTYLEYRGQFHEIDTLTIVSKLDSTERELTLNTNRLNFKAAGDFDISVFSKDLVQLLKEYKLNLANNRNALNNYYSNKKIDEEKDYEVTYEMNLKDINPFVNLFVPELYISSGTEISGMYTGGYTSIVSLNANPDSLRYGDNYILDTDFELSVSKIADSTDVLAMVFLTSNDQQFGRINTNSLLVEGIWNKNHIDFELDVQQTDFPNRAHVFGSVDFTLDSTAIKFLPSNISILDNKWVVDRNNIISVKGKEIEVRDLELSFNEQHLRANGYISSDSLKSMVFDVENLQLSLINSVLQRDIGGLMNGHAELRNYYGALSIQNNLTVDDFMVEEFIVGNIVGSNTWNRQLNLFDVNFNISREQKDVLNLAGTFNPGEEQSLDFNAQLDKLDLRILRPFFNRFFSDIVGQATGNISITGTIDKPALNGRGILSNSGLHVNYLNTDYRFVGNFYFKENAIGFENVNLQDNNDSRGVLNGEIRHTYFKNFFMDVSANFEDFLLLNTTSKDNNLFYGTGIGTGNVRFFGPVNNMNIIAQARTEKDTRIFIPLSGTDDIQTEEYISFVNLRDSITTKIENAVQNVDLRGLKLDFDLDITPDAYAEIIFDIKSGDIIRGRGNGDLKLSIDTKGEFNMFGDFVIEQGGYNFTLYNVINKEFEILSDSKISWYGDPYQGILDISASYNQLASLLPLIVTQDSDTVYEQSIEMRRNYPVKVLLDIEGPLLSPEVDFDITANNLPRNVVLPTGEVKDLEFEFLAFKNQIDEQELKRQVFSLIVLRRFSPLQSFNTGGSITNSVSELFSNQLSYWITQVDENLEIDVDLGKLDEEAFNTFQLRLSYTFLDGRLRVTRDGGFTNQQNRADISSIAGDWTLEYLLTPDGKFKVKMYNRTNYNPIDPSRDDQNTVTTGFSIQHTQSFNEIKELFKKTRDKARSNQPPAGDDLPIEESAEKPNARLPEDEEQQ